MRLLLFVIVFLVAGPAIAEESRTLAGPTKTVEGRARALGERSSSSFLFKFKSALQGAMKEGGPLHAVSYCSSKVPTLTKEVKASLPAGVEFKRTSWKVRNSQNKPDEYEVEALTYFEEQIRSGMPEDAPAFYLQKTKSEYRYYKAIKIQPVCLTCHGEKQMLSGELQEVLEEKYPFDKATGYKVGELRGLLRVSMPLEVLQ